MFGYDEASSSRGDDLPVTVPFTPAPDPSASQWEGFSTPALTPPPVNGAGLSRSAFRTDFAGPAVPVAMPHPGETFLGFHLIEELGRGSFARVFLAKQDALAGRAVALKVTLKATREAERLARLQHTNVVPVYSVHDAPPVHVICMPFLGRRTIADLLKDHRGSRRHVGLSTRHATRGRRGSTVAGRSGSRSFPGTSPDATTAGTVHPLLPGTPGAGLIGDVPAVLRVLGQLADGLAHAHDRGILHLDLKPGNVLLADSGEPMLLDFNLSFDAAEVNRELVGGTVAYMAPEQLLDLRTRGLGAVDARTDLYSLGVMTFEMLTGKNPFPNTAAALADFDGLMAARRKGPPPLRDANPGVTPAAEAIVRKLLAPDPADRYQTAADLREDVRRQSTDLPLRFAADRSIPERVRKWRRRNPRALVAIGVVAVVAAAALSGGVAYRESEKTAAADAVAHALKTRSSLDTTRLDLVLPGHPNDRARGRKRTRELLASYGLPDDPDWRHSAAFRNLPAIDRPRTAADLGELLLLLAHAEADTPRTADEPTRRTAATAALRLNERADDCFAGLRPPPALARQRAELVVAAGGEAGGEPGGMPPQPPTSARDHFLDAAALIRASKFAAAIPPLEAVLAEQPTHAAGHFFLAYCRQQVGDYERAVERYDVAAALMPDDPRPFGYRGDVYILCGNPTCAESDYSRAIAVDSTTGDKFRDRAFARQRLGKNRDAEYDLTSALDRGSSPLRIHLLRAQVRDALGDTTGAAADRTAAAGFLPVTERDYWERGLTRVAGAPAGALEDFQSALKINPAFLPAVQSQINVLSDRLDDLPQALVIATRLSETYPEYLRARSLRAVLLARDGRRDDAHREAERVQLRKTDPFVTYRVACVYALTSATHEGDRPLAVSLLRQAYRDGFRDDAMYTTDTDLAALRTSQEFIEFMTAYKQMSRR